MIAVALAVLILVFPFFRFTPLGFDAGGSAECGVQSTGRSSCRPDVSLQLEVGRCNWSGGRNDGAAARLSRPLG
jgi:hypothetical protein